ncbi:FAD-binding and (Fe-S)-binding domain-containing protein [Phycicoccus jejuensis]|uniref:FAD-binding and (Fe-S)-binding domain-containing protein n=1 Tax=Phycicoccus jejuensis TaxID=367299 RepID=UPI000A03EB42|nr:FAD-binding and (Fe-S)-binding domain-containing protein [Phycicoccus jejuensis]
MTTPTDREVSRSGATDVVIGPSMAQELRRHVVGEVRADAGARAAYAVDSSNYRQVPLAVVNPRTIDDGVAALTVCAERGVPVLSRGGGTSLAGQSTNEAVVLDWSTHCHRLVSVDPENRTCVVEPGIALDELNRQLAEYDLMFGPKPSTHRSCTLGGMIGNNSCGSTAQAYGKTVDNITGLEVLTADGLRMWVGPTSDEQYADILAAGGRRAQIYAGLRELRDTHLELLRTRYPDIPRRVSGYNLDALLPEHHFDLARALVGSEGTLVTVLHARLQLVPIPKAKAMVVLGYPDIATAGDAVPQILPHQPWQLEGMDQVLLSLEQQAQLAGKARQDMPTGGGWLMVVFDGDDQDDADAKAKNLLDDVEHHDHPPTYTFLDDPAKETELVEVREAGLGATAHPRGRHETWEGWEDAAVPPDRLGDYLRDFRALLNEFGYAQDETSLYGHFGQGCVHTRIPFELRTVAGIAHYRAFVEAGADLVVSYGGSLSGEHGDGQSKAELLPKMFGDDVVALFEQTKTLFDPQNRMNPGKVVRPHPLDNQLRLGPDYTHPEPATYFSYPDDQGRFSTAAMRCVGIGNCRSAVSDEQVMCPSYMVTRQEEHSTRGRARLLFEMMRGTTITDGWRSTAVRDALDLCLSCKGCKSDCPVGVDMATYKAEFLAHHYRHRVRPRSHYSMGWLPLLAQAAGRAPRAVNALTGSPLAPLLKAAGGIAPQRDIPRFAPRSFVTAWKHRPPSPSRPDGRHAPLGPVLLWPDTFTNHFDPDIAVSAVRVLEDAGFEVRLPTRPVCCGLTWISTGQLDVAAKVLRRTLRVLRSEIRAGTPVVGLEPSCTAVFRSDGTDLLAGDEDMRRLSKQTFTLAELLTKRAPHWRPPRVEVDALVQTHCHQHAVLGTDPDTDLMRAAGIDADRLASGCCGLAGNFGFEAGHYEVSRAAGERVLLPAVRAVDPATAVLADGFSCRTQIAQGDTGRTAVHLAQLLASGLETSPPARGEPAGEPRASD